MKTKHIILHKINAMQQSRWMRPALMTLAFLFAVLGATGCDPHH